MVCLLPNSLAVLYMYSYVGIHSIYFVTYFKYKFVLTFRSVHWTVGGRLWYVCGRCQGVGKFHRSPCYRILYPGLLSAPCSWCSGRQVWSAPSLVLWLSCQGWAPLQATWSVHKWSLPGTCCQLGWWGEGQPGPSQTE